MRKRATLLVLVVALSACGGDENPITPSSQTISGRWTGMTMSRVFGSSAAAQVTFAQNGSSISGTWSTSSSQGINSGNLIGTISGGALSATLFTSNPLFCGFTVTATIQQNTLTGDYATRSCSVTDTGTVRLIR